MHIKYIKNNSYEILFLIFFFLQYIIRETQ